METQITRAAIEGWTRQKEAEFARSPTWNRGFPSSVYFVLGGLNLLLAVGQFLVWTGTHRTFQLALAAMYVVVAVSWTAFAVQRFKRQARENSGLAEP